MSKAEIQAMLDDLNFAFATYQQKLKNMHDLASSILAASLQDYEDETHDNDTGVLDPPLGGSGP
jgi:hypothetical protein